MVAPDIVELDQTKQLRYGARAYGGHPEPPHVGIRGLETIRAFPESCRHGWAFSRRGPERSARVPRGCFRRTMMAACGRFGSHAETSTSER